MGSDKGGSHPMGCGDSMGCDGPLCGCDPMCCSEPMGLSGLLLRKRRTSQRRLSEDVNRLGRCSLGFESLPAQGSSVPPSALPSLGPLRSCKFSDSWPKFAKLEPNVTEIAQSCPNPVRVWPKLSDSGRSHAEGSDGLSVPRGMGFPWPAPPRRLMPKGLVFIQIRSGKSQSESTRALSVHLRAVFRNRAR